MNGWYLWLLVSLPISLTIVSAMMSKDLENAEAVSSMIQLSVRCSVPWLFLAFGASSFHTLFPGWVSQWLLRNRKIIGLCFSSAMAWQLLFILWLVGIHTQYYTEEVYVLSDVVEGVVGYACLILMALTSFKFGRRRISAKNWKLLHKFGIYWLWAYAWSVYWWNLFYYQNPEMIDYIYYWSGFLVWGLRIGAWIKKSNIQTSAPVTPRWLLLAPGILFILTGLTGLTLGANWSPQVFEFFVGIKIMDVIGTYMPFFPFVPFYPMAIIVAGALLLRKSNKTAATI